MVGRLNALAAGCVLLALPAGASAADMPVKAPAPVAFAPGNWSGLYGGIHGGWGWGDAGYAFDPYLSMGYPVAPQLTGGTFDQELDGGLFGGHLGYNHQHGSWVFGLEASLAWSGIDGTSVDAFFPDPIVAPGYTYETRLNWLATLTPRVGYAAQNWLFTVKGGLAAGEVESTVGGPGPVAALTARTFRERNDHVGWTLGVGAEYAWTPNWILGVEYNYVDLGKQFYGGLPQQGSTVSVGEYSADIAFSTVMARLSYKPDAPAGMSAFAAAAPVHAAGWSGFYAGVHGGWGWGDAGYAFTPGTNGSTGGGLQDRFAPETGGAFTQSLDGGLFGGHLGFNAQRGAWLLGLEGSLTRSGLKGQSANVFPGVPPAGTSIYDTELKWLATVTPRLGYAAGEWLVYAKGGLAAGRVGSKLSNVSIPEGQPFEETTTYVGWTLGAGIEYAWRPNWTLGVEYNYVDLGSQHYGGFAYIPAITCCVDYDVDLTISTVLARLSYRWGER